MNSEEAEARIALRVHIDVLIGCIDAPDEEGVVWETDPYDVVVTEGKLTTPAPAAPIDDGQWLIAVLVGTAVGLLVAVVALLLVAWSVYAALGVLLWLMVNSVS